MPVFNLTENEKFEKYVQKFRKKIPKEYNQCELLDELTNKDLTHYFSISNRSDGKSTNYLHFFIRLSIDYDVKFSMIYRHYTLRDAFEETIFNIFETFDDLQVSKLSFQRKQFYVIIYYGDKAIGILFDLNNASDLKLFSSFLKKFPMMIYDEFLALSEDYVTDEYQKIKIIYTTIDKNFNEEIPIILKPKIFYLGNAVNFDSPILLGMKMFNILENHEINTMEIYGNIILENRFNENIEKMRKKNVFPDEENDNLLTGQFEVNNYNLSDENTKARINHAKRFFYIKLQNEYLRVEYNFKTFDSIVLAIEPYIMNKGSYSFNTELSDNTSNSKYLTDSFYDVEHFRFYDRGLIKFENSFSKKFITKDSMYRDIIIRKCISFYESKNESMTITEKQEILKDDRMKLMKEKFVSKFFNRN